MLQKLFKYLPIHKYQITGNSMNPTLKNGDIVLVSRFSYFLQPPRTGDIIAVIDPRHSKILIKRIFEFKNSKYFVIGDNENHSTDSRKFGWIGKKDIIGKVVFTKIKD